jgi:signal transduction histidine kinase
MDYKLIFDASPQLFLILKPDSPAFTIQDANAAYTTATLTKRGEITGKGLFEVFPDNPEDVLANGVSNLRRSLEKVLESKQQDVMPVQKYDVPVTTASGTVFEEKYWNPKNTPVLNDAGEILYIIHQVEDVTAAMQSEKRRLIEAENASAEIRQQSLLLKENKDRIDLILDALLKFTTMDFTERLGITDKRDELDAIAFGLNSLVDELENHMQLLKQFNAELAEANNELDSFSYSVSHDLRAPLRAIGGYSRILLEDYGNMLDEDGKKIVGVLIRNASKMGKLIDDLLTFSHAGKQNLTKVTLNMNNLVKTVVNELTHDKESSTKFVIKTLKETEGDSSMMKQVLTNLISNAIKYSSKKEQSSVEIGNYEEQQNMIYYVKDNGAGFDMKYYNKLFGVFQRLHSAAEFEGTGVGLALVQRIIKKHGGDVWAESKPEEGATFFFSLPITLH